MKFKEVVKMIEEHQGKQLSWIELEVFEEFIKKDGFDADMLAEAFKKSILNEAEKPLTYMRTILKEWRKAGIKTVADVKRADDEFEAEKKQSASNWKTPKPYNSYGKLPNKIPANQVPPLPPNAKRF